MYHNIKIIDPNIGDIFDKLDDDHKHLVCHLIEGCKIANLIYSDQVHPDARELIKLFKHLYLNYPKYDPLYDPVILANLKLYTEFLISTHSQYNLINHKEYPPIDNSTLVSLAQLTRYPIPVNDVLNRLFDKSDEILIVDGNVQKSHVGHYGIDKSKKTKKHIDSLHKIGLNSKIIDDPITVVSYSMKGQNSEDMKLAHSWFKKAYELCKIPNSTISPTIEKALSKLLIFLQEGTEESLTEYQNFWTKIEGPVDFLFSPFEVYMDPLHKMGSYAGEVTIESVNMVQFKKIWIKLENDLPFPDEFKSQNQPGNMSFRTKIYSAGSNGPIRMVSAYCLPNSSEETKQVIYTYSSPITNPYLNKHFEQTDMLSFNVNIAYKIHLVLHEWAHATGKFTKNVDGTIITSVNLSEYITKDFSSLEELRAETFAIWTFVNNYKNLVDCFEDMKKVGKSMGEKAFKELYVTLVLNDGIRRLAGCSGDPKEAHARANMVLTNYVLSHGGLEIVEEPVDINGVIVPNLGCKINLDKTMYAVKKLSIQVQSIKSTGNGNANERLFNWFVKNPIGSEKMKLYAQKVKDKTEAILGTKRIEVENYPILVKEGEKIVLKNTEFISI
jgi:hypothetical protein